MRAAQGFGSFSVHAECSQAKRVVPLGQSNSKRVRYQRAMEEFRRGVSQRPVEEQLASCGAEEIFAPDDFRDAHRGIVHRHGKLIRGNVVVAPDDKISEVFAGNELLRPVMAIYKSDRFSVGNSKPPIDSGQ